MRITNNMLSQNYLNNLNKNMSNMNVYQAQLSSNRRITKLSDDPIGAISSLSVRTKLNRIEQHTRNIDDAKAWLTQSETSVMEVNEVIKSIYEETLKISNDTYSDVDRKASLQYIEQLRDHLVQVGNSSFGNKYIFGGYNTSSPPFQVVAGKVEYNAIDLSIAPQATITNLQSQNIEYEIGTGITTKSSITGVDLFGFGETNMFNVLDNLISDIKAGMPSNNLSAYVGKLQSKQEDVLSQVTEIGGRVKRLDLVSSRYELDKNNFEAVKSNVEDIDTAEVIMRLKMTEASYNTALAIGNKIIQQSLADYLR